MILKIAIVTIILYFAIFRKQRKYAIGVIRWRFSKPQYLGRVMIYRGRRRKIVGETFETITLGPISKKGLRIKSTIINKIDIQTGQVQ